MTSRFYGYAVLLSAAAAAVAIGSAGIACARQNDNPPRPAAPPRPVVIQPTASQQRFREDVRQSQVRDQLRKGQVENQLHQQSLELTRRPAGSLNPNDTQVDQAQESRNRLYQAQQRDRLQRYSEALTPQPVPQARQVGDAGNDSSKDGDGNDRHGKNDKGNRGD